MKRKNSGGIVFSTNPDFIYESGAVPENETLPPGKQQLRIRTESKGRGGKTVTVISGFAGTLKDMESLAKELKLSCGAGGSVKDGLILIQGDVRVKVLKYLTEKGYKAK